MGYFGLASQLKLFDRLDQWSSSLHSNVLLETVEVILGNEDANSFDSAYLSVKRSDTLAVDKGCWHMSKTIASGVGLTNAWLAEQGMVSIKTLWAQLAPIRRTA